MWISGSMASLVASVPPDIVRSVHGETSQAQAGRFLAGRAQAVDQPQRRLPPALSPPTAMSFGGNALPAQKAPCRERIFMGGRVRMFGREAVVDRKRARLCRAAGLRHHAAVADNRARAISATMKIQKDAPGRCRVRATTRRDAVAIDRLAFDVAQYASTIFYPIAAKSWSASGTAARRCCGPSRRAPVPARASALRIPTRLHR